MRLFSRTVVFSACLIALFISAATGAAEPTETLLPDTVKGVILIPDVEELDEKWDQTQFGQMMKDPGMEAFMKDFRRQMQAKLDQAGIRLGVSMSDVGKAAGGEASLSVIQPGGDKDAHAMVLLVDSTGKLAEARALLKQVEKDLTEQGGKKSIVRIAGEDVTEFTVKDKKKAKIYKVYYKILNNYLLAADHKHVTTGILSRVKGDALPGDKTLNDVPAFKYSMAQSAQASGIMVPHIRWFIEPFGYAEVRRAAKDEPAPVSPDLLKILQEQGFDAIQGLGGHVQLMSGGHEILHHSFIYAPGEYRLAARMLEFPRTTLLLKVDGTGMAEPLNGGTLPDKLRDAFDAKRIQITDKVEVRKSQKENEWLLVNDDSRQYELRIVDGRMHAFTSTSLEPQPWIPRAAAMYGSYKWNMRKAFEMSETLVDAILENKGAFDDIMNTIKIDPEGPKIDVPNDLVAHIGDRVSVLTDYRLPITTKSERVMVAIELTNPALAKATLDKAMDYEPTAFKRVFRDHIILEIKNEEDEEESIKVDTGGARPLFPKGDNFGARRPKNGNAQKTQLPNSALTVAHGHLIVATHVDFVRDMLKGVKERDTLRRSVDFRVINRALEDLGAGRDSFRYFVRLDEAYRPTFELVKAGKMPEAETMLAKLLNKMLGPDEEGVKREQVVDGSELPDFQTVRRYLGPAGAYIENRQNGWIMIGCVLNSELE